MIRISSLILRGPQTFLLSTPRTEVNSQAERIYINTNCFDFLSIFSNPSLIMIYDPNPLELPASYEKFPTSGHVVVSHHPPGTPSVTPVLIVTLNRPANHNAFTGQMVQDFEKLFPLFNVDERVKVIVLTGAGKTFCAGADLEIGFSGAREKTTDPRDG